ncbi:MAG: hypothetical protein HY529_04675 [Chloroflexi bacterium]|nr:hypothetical protein [Chloroflexota bacterium]
MGYFQAGIAELNPKRADTISTNSGIAFTVPGFDPINIWFENGQLKLTTILRNSQGQIIARIDANQFRMTANDIKYDLNFDTEALEIVNPENVVVLQVQLSGNTANVQGVFYSSSGELCIVDEYSVRVNPKDVSVNIKPIFKHPGIKYIAQRLSKQ